MKRFDKLLLIWGLVGGLLLAAALPLYSAPQSPAADIAPAYNDIVQPGALVVYAHTLTNTQTVTDTFLVVAHASEGWPVEVRGAAYPGGTVELPIWNLGPGMTATLQVSLTVPVTVSGGVVNTTTVTATSRYSPTATATVQNIARVDARRIYLPLVLRAYPPVWTRLSGTAGVSVYDVAACPSDPHLLYAGTSERGVYRSLDGGNTWQPWLFDGQRSTPVVFDAACTAYVALWGNGVYRLPLVGAPVLVNAEVSELNFVYGLALSPDEQTLYAGSDSAGVYKAPVSTFAWTHISGGVADQRIRSLYAIGDTLYAGGRGCRLYRFDAQDNVTLETVASVCNDEQVWAVASFGGYLYAGLGDLGLYRRPLTGGAWEAAPGAEVRGSTIFRYGLAATADRLYVGVYGKGVSACPVAGPCTPLLNAGLGEPSIRGLLIFTSTTDTYLLAASDNGLWRLKLAP